MIKIRINEGLPDLCIKAWYYHLEGEEYRVIQSDILSKYRLIFNDLHIDKKFCTVISDDTEQEEKEFVLPEKWCVSHCKESLAWIKKNGENNASNIRENRYYYMPCDENKDNSSGNKPIGYTEITQDQFFAHVWEKEFKKEESKGYCIKRTSENAEVLNSYFNKIKIEHGIDQTYRYYGNYGYFYMPILPWTHLSDNLLEGYTELRTVEEFFAKVGYTPKASFNFDSSNLTITTGKDVLSDLLTYNPKPVLIAKAGEWVKITSFGKIKSGYKYIINKPYLLTEDLNKEHGFTAVDEELSVNGYYWRSIISEGIIFKRCEAPASVVQETTERIPFDLEKYNTGKYDVVTRIGLPIRILATDRNYGSSPIFALVLRGEELARIFDINGICYQETDHNLLLVAKTETVFENVWHFECYTKLEAEIDSKKNKSNGKFIETIEVKRPIK